MRTWRNPGLSVLGGALFAAALTVVGGHVPRVAADPADIVIDDFSTDQGPLTLTYPTPGPLFSATDPGSPGILGGERELILGLDPVGVPGATATAGVSGGSFDFDRGNSLDAAYVSMAWDGADGAATVDPTGLGSLDLTLGGRKDALALTIGTLTGSNMKIEVVVQSDAGRSSKAIMSLPNPIAGATTVVFPFAAFAPEMGTGADFASVGAIVLGLSSIPQQMTLTSLTTTTVVNASMSDALAIDLNSNAIADPGDTLQYTTVVTNPDDDPSNPNGLAALNARLEIPLISGTSLVVGSVTTTQGTVDVGNGAGATSVAVDLGSVIDWSPSATVTFRVTIGAYTGNITAQGELTYAMSALPGAPRTPTDTDDPDTATFSDGTVTLVAEPIPTVSIADSPDVLEGDTGTVPAEFEISLSAPYTSGPVTVHVTTGGGTATAGTDYTPVDHIVVFAPNDPTTQTLSVDVLGDTADEPDETFSVQLTDADNATIDRATALALIIDDDVPPVDTSTTSTTSTTPPPGTTTSPDSTAPPTTPPGSTAPTPPTTAALAPVVPPTLPTTGGSPSALAIWALLILGIGGALTLAVRRRRTT